MDGADPDQIAKILLCEWHGELIGGGAFEQCHSFRQSNEQSSQPGVSLRLTEQRAALHVEDAFLL